MVRINSLVIYSKVQDGAYKQPCDMEIIKLLEAVINVYLIAVVRVLSRLRGYT